MAFIVLFASFLQKYDLSADGLHKENKIHFEAINIKPESERRLPATSNGLRGSINAKHRQQLTEISDQHSAVFQIELRWLIKISEAVKDGRLEKIRQSGIYLDTDAQLEVVSTPNAVERIEAERWSWAATRVLNLLEHGTYFQAYSPLAELLIAANASEKESKHLLDEAMSVAEEAIMEAPWEQSSHPS